MRNFHSIWRLLSDIFQVSKQLVGSGVVEVDNRTNEVKMTTIDFVQFLYKLICVDFGLYIAKALNYILHTSNTYTLEIPHSYQVDKKESF